MHIFSDKQHNLAIAHFQATHKIQSSDGLPDLKLQQTPKMLKCLVSDWVPNAFVVSFKVPTSFYDCLSRREHIEERSNCLVSA